MQIYDLLAIFCGYLGMSYIFKYRTFRKKEYLVAAICGILAAVFNLSNYVLQIW